MNFNPLMLKCVEILRHSILGRPLRDLESCVGCLSLVCLCVFHAFPVKPFNTRR